MEGVDYVKRQVFQQCPLQKIECLVNQKLYPLSSTESIVYLAPYTTGIYDEIVRPLVEDPFGNQIYICKFLKLLCNVFSQFDETDDRIFDALSAALLKTPFSQGECNSNNGDGATSVYFTIPQQGFSSIKLLEQRQTLSVDGSTGYRTWEAALALSEYIVSNPSTFIGKNCLELGAGTGLVGILLASMGCHVDITDGDEGIVKQLYRNVDIQPSSTKSNLHVSKFDWSDTQFVDENGITTRLEENNWDMILGADVVYEIDSVYALTGLLSRLLLVSNNEKKNAFALICITRRKPESLELFINECNNIGLHVSLCDDFDQREDTFFYSKAGGIDLWKVSVDST